MKTLRFYKEENGTWWIDLPEYPGPKSDLQMVAGADDMLDSLSQGKTEVKLDVSEQRMEGFSGIQRVDDIPTLSGRYYYNIDTELLMWLCDVTLRLFEGRFPEVIWYKQIR